MSHQKAVKDYVAIIDIGSNAVRLVIYDGLNRAPVKIHAEREVCQLGKDLATTGYLNAEGVEKALSSITRFGALITAMKIKHTRAVATAAIRDAQDGAKFITRVQKLSGLDVQVVDGEEEARLSALGVMMNGMASSGVIGDFGGGSLELIWVEKGVLKKKASLPLGSHRLHALKNRAARIAAIDAMIDGVSFIAQVKDVDFYALGGSWRSLAKAHMRMVDHPIYILDHYAIAGKKAHEFADLISRQSPASLEKAAGLSKRRVRDMAVAALALERIFEKMKPRQLVFSGTGLREGLVYDALSTATRKQDALIASCRKFALRSSRFEDVRAFHVLAKWMMPLFPKIAPDTARLIEASCLLSDSCWFEHEDYQAQQAFQGILVLPFYGANHQARAFLALSQYVRYRGHLRRDARGKDKSEATRPAQLILQKDDIDLAVVAGLAQRMAYHITGGALGLLKDTTLKLGAKTLTLEINNKSSSLRADLCGDVLTDLAHALGKTARIEN